MLFSANVKRLLCVSPDAFQSDLINHLWSLGDNSFIFRIKRNALPLLLIHQYHAISLHMRVSKVGLFVVSILLPLTGVAQQTYTLEQCIDKALERNLSLKQQQLSVKLSASSLTQSKFDLLPTVNGQAGFGANFGRSVDPTTNNFVDQTIKTTNASIQSDLTLFNGLKKINSVKKSKLDLKANEFDYKEMQNNITLNVISSFLRVLVSKEELALAEKQLDFSKKQIEKTEKLVDAGAQPDGELEQVRSQMMADRHQKTVSQNNLQIAKLNLKQLMELDAADSISIQVPDTIEYSIAEVSKRSPETIYQQAVQQQPTIKSAEFEMMSAQKGIAISKANYYPRLSAFYNIQTNFSDANQQIISVEPTGQFDTLGFVSGELKPVVSPNLQPNTETTPLSTQLDRNLRQSVGVSLTIPIFNKWQTRTAVEQSQVQLEQTEMQLRQEKNQLEKDIQEAYTQAKAAARQLESARQSVKALEKSFSYANERFQLGMLNSFEYASAKNQLSEAKSSFIRAKYDYIFKLKILDFYQGNAITLE